MALLWFTRRWEGEHTAHQFAGGDPLHGCTDFKPVPVVRVETNKSRFKSGHIYLFACVRSIKGIYRIAKSVRSWALYYRREVVQRVIVGYDLHLRSLCFYEISL